MSHAGPQRSFISNRFDPPMDSSHYYHRRPSGGIDVEALAAGVQRYIPSSSSFPHSHSHNHHHGSGSTTTSNGSYIALPPGIDPASVDFRTFYPYNPSEVKHRKRTTRQQLKILEDTFRRETKPNAGLRKTLAAQLEMTPRGVQVWFQNRRAKEKALAKKASSGDRKSINLHGDDADDDADDQNQELDQTEREDEMEDQNENEAGAAPDGNGDMKGNESGSGDAAASVAATAEQASGSSSFSSGPGAGSAQPSPASSSSSPSLVRSPESAAPSAIRVSVSPPVEDMPGSGAAKNERRLSGSPTGTGVSRMSWEGRSISDSTHANMNTGTGIGSSMHHNLQAKTPTPMDDGLYSLRRPSLPTHLPSAALPFSSPLSGNAGGPPSAFRQRSTLGVGAPSARGVGVNAFPRGFDPSARRLSLDRLASHPYAHIALQANGAVYGAGRFRSSLVPTHAHARLPIGTKAHTSPASIAQQQQLLQAGQLGAENSNQSQLSMSAGSTPTHTPQQRRPELPGQEMEVDMDAQAQAEQQLQAEQQEHQQMQLMQQNQAFRPELMHRASLPAHPVHFRNPFPATPHMQQMQQQVQMDTDPSPGPLAPPPMSADSRMRFPRAGHMYGFPSRSYAPPAAGPLPNPDFSFGAPTPTPSSGESRPGSSAGIDAIGVGTSAASSTHSLHHLQNYSFPADAPHDGSVSDPANAGVNVSLDDEMQRPEYDFYASRFGSIASIAESESSVASGYYSEVGGSSYEMASASSQSQSLRNSLHQPLGQPGFDDGRRPSCTGQMLDMFSNLDVHNGSSASLAHSLSHEAAKQESPGNMVTSIQSQGQMQNQAQSDVYQPQGQSGGYQNPGQPNGATTTTYPSPSSTVSAGSNDRPAQLPQSHSSERVTISHSSELAYALQPDNGHLHQSGAVVDTAGDVSTQNMGANGVIAQPDASDASSFSNSHRSSSEVSSLLYPLSASASSSRSSLGLHPPAVPSSRPRLDMDKLDFLHNYDAVSETGHYSPVSHPSTVLFDISSNVAMDVQQPIDYYDTQGMVSVPPYAQPYLHQQAEHSHPSLHDQQQHMQANAQNQHHVQLYADESQFVKLDDFPGKDTGFVPMQEGLAYGIHVGLGGEHQLVHAHSTESFGYNY